MKKDTVAKKDETENKAAESKVSEKAICARQPAMPAESLDDNYFTSAAPHAVSEDDAKLQWKGNTFFNSEKEAMLRHFVAQGLTLNGCAAVMWHETTEFLVEPLLALGLDIVNIYPNYGLDNGEDDGSPDPQLIFVPATEFDIEGRFTVPEHLCSAFYCMLGMRKFYEDARIIFLARDTAFRPGRLKNRVQFTDPRDRLFTPSGLFRLDNLKHLYGTSDAPVDVTVGVWQAVHGKGTRFN